jgi:hypothetical protein
MNSTSTLTFLWTAWSAGLSVGVVLLVAGLCFAAWRRSGYARAQGLLELFRLALVAVMALTLNQPEWVEEFRPEEKPAVVVLWDNSPSMETRDVPVSAGGSGQITRREAIAKLIDDATWGALRERMNVIVQPFSGPEVGQRTDLYEPLAQAPEKVKNLAGVVLISDGDWNDGPPPVQAATKLRLKGVPVFSVPVGSTTRLPDVELVSLGAPTFGVVGKAVRIPFSIDSTLPREYLTTVTLKTSEGEEVTEEVRIAAMGRTNGSVLWKPAKIGDVTLTLEVPKHPDEIIADNNKLSAPIAIREEKLRVLLVESQPRWEYRYLRNALSRDPGVEVSCLLFHPGLSKVGGGTKDYIKQFPAGLDELSKFDVVFLGDVGIDDGQLTAEQCRLLKGLVEHQASGLVFMPGSLGRQFWPTRRRTISKSGMTCPASSGTPRSFGPRAGPTCWPCIRTHPTNKDGCRCWSLALSGRARCCSWAPTARGAGGRASRTNTTTASGARSSAGWPTSGTWPRAKRCGSIIRRTSRRCGKPSLSARM